MGAGVAVAWMWGVAVAVRAGVGHRRKLKLPTVSPHTLKMLNSLSHQWPCLLIKTATLVRDQMIDS